MDFCSIPTDMDKMFWFDFSSAQKTMRAFFFYSGFWRWWTRTRLQISKEGHD